MRSLEVDDLPHVGVPLARRLERRLLFAGARRRELPDFLVIGAQKAGTTWLHRKLSAHPDVFLPDRKELHYFDRGLGRSLSS